jgi:hypothetical protein
LRVNDCDPVVFGDGLLAGLSDRDRAHRLAVAAQAMIDVRAAFGA